jgi:Carboxypeptidase regulatory-like domain/TonB-dependent Receptor Plug Domain
MLLQKCRAFAVVALTGLVCLMSRTAQAQTTSASVTGAVTDAQGGTLPGVTVTLTSTTQGNALTAVSNASGRFVFAYVQPGRYSLKVALTGFKTIENSNVQVNANDKFNAGTIAMAVGDMSENVTVVSRISELQAQSGERSFTLESKAIENIAVDGRSFFGLVALVPGVLPNADTGGTRAGGTPAQSSNFTANGQRPGSNNMTIDGVANIDTGDNGGNMATTNIDAIAEFKVLTNAYQAEYGRAVGAQVQAVTKSGSQEFHGSGYWYGRRSDWAANSWSNNRAAAPAPVGNGALIPKTETARNDFGYTIGGPVFVPGKFNTDKKELFFFFSQEFQRRKDPVPETRATVPTALERLGDFSQSRDSSGNLFPYIKDYQSGLPCETTTTGNHSGCFQDGGVLGRIPQSRLYQPGLNALKIYPLPNVNGQSGYNFTSQDPTARPRREELLRLDFHPSDNWRFTGRYMQNTDVQDQPYGVTWAGAGGNVPIADTHQEIPGRNWLVSTTGVLNPTTSLEVSVGSAHNSLNIGLANPLLTRTGAGVQALPLLYPDAVQVDTIPQFDFNGGRVGTNAGRIQSDRGPFTNFNTTYDMLANLTKISGSHAIKVGAYYQSSLKPQSPFTSFNSLINFRDDATFDQNTGFGYANAATGVFNTYTQASKYALPEWSYRNIEGYIQDNWKASRKLTLDYGVRLYYLTPQWDTTEQASTFLPDKYDPAKSVSLYTPVCANGVYPCSGANRVGEDPRAIAAGIAPNASNTGIIGRIVPGSGDRFNGSFQAGQGVDKTLSSGSAFRVSPRFGFAYDLTGKQSTILRGGAGVFYDRPQGNMVFDNITNAPGIQVSTISGGGLLQNIGGATAASQAPAPVSLQPTVFDFKPPVVYSWNLGLQTKLPYALIFDIAYVGSESRNLLRKEQINAVPYGAKFLPQNQDRTLAPNATPGATALPDDFLRPYQGYSGIRLWKFDAYSNYHALQTAINRRFDKGLLIGVSYVWSKNLGISNDDQTDFNRPNSTAEDIRRADYSYSAYDRPHSFTANFVYQTPKLVKGIAGGLINDWQISGVYHWTSGTPYTINFSIPGVGAANLTGSDGNQNARVVVTGDPGKGWTSDPYVQLNTSALAPPQSGSLGFESARFFVHGPPINNLDMSISKSFPLGRSRKFEVRLDAFNALNHTQFTGVNSTVNFTSLTNPTITNLATDASGNVVRNNGFGSVTGVRLPRQIQIVTRLVF